MNFVVRTQEEKMKKRRYSKKYHVLLSLFLTNGKPIRDILLSFGA